MAARRSLVIHRSPSLESFTTDSVPSTPVKPHFINPFTAEFIKRSSECWEVPPIPFVDYRPPSSLTLFSHYPFHHAASTQLPQPITNIFNWLNKRKRHILMLFVVLCFVSVCTIMTDYVHKPSHRRSSAFISLQDVFAAGPTSRPYSHMAHFNNHRLQEDLVLTQHEELGALVSFMAANSVNALPDSVDPSLSLDLQLFLDFDTRSEGASEELETLLRETWSSHPVIILSKLFSPLARDIKAIIAAYSIYPKATIWEIDARADKDIITPLLMRLTNSTELPVLLIGGQAVGLSDDYGSLESNSARTVYSRIKDMQATGELETLIKSSGVIVGAGKKPRRPRIPHP